MGQEKVTINLTPLELGKIDLLVEQGEFTSRTDAIRSAVRRELDLHTDLIAETVKRNYFTVGIEFHSRKDLEKYKARGERVAIKAVGLIKLADDIDPDLADAVIESVKVLGVFRARPDVLKRLSDRVAKRAE